MAIYETNGVKAPVDPVTAQRLADDRAMEAILKRPGRSLLVAAQYRLWQHRAVHRGGLDPAERRAVLILKNLAAHWGERHVNPFFLVEPWDYQLNARRVRTI